MLLQPGGERHHFILPIATLLLVACSDESSSRDAGSMDAGPDASIGHTHDAGRMLDAGGGASDAGHVTRTCPRGNRVASRSDCLQDEAYCFALADDAGWCTGAAAPQCPAGAQPIDAFDPCPVSAKCFQFSESLRCMIANDEDASFGDEDGGEVAIDLFGADRDAQVSVAVGERVDVFLQTIGQGEYGEPMLSSTAVKFLGAESPPSNPGGPMQIYHFRCVAPGTSVITIPHSDQGEIRLTLQCG